MSSLIKEKTQIEKKKNGGEGHMKTALEWCIYKSMPLKYVWTPRMGSQQKLEIWKEFPPEPSEGAKPANTFI